MLGQASVESTKITFRIKFMDFKFYLTFVIISSPFCITGKYKTRYYTKILNHSRCFECASKVQ